MTLSGIASKFRSVDNDHLRAATSLCFVPCWRQETKVRNRHQRQSHIYIHCSLVPLIVVFTKLDRLQFREQRHLKKLYIDKGWTPSRRRPGQSLIVSLLCNLHHALMFFPFVRARLHNKLDWTHQVHFPAIRVFDHSLGISANGIAIHQLAVIPFLIQCTRLMLISKLKCHWSK